MYCICTRGGKILKHTVKKLGEEILLSFEFNKRFFFICGRSLLYILRQVSSLNNVKEEFKHTSKLVLPCTNEYLLPSWRIRRRYFNRLPIISIRSLHGVAISTVLNNTNVVQSRELVFTSWHKDYCITSSIAVSQTNCPYSFLYENVCLVFSKSTKYYKAASFN